ncbi:CaiB/BaiF CoA-transferase family protein [Polynucleobacter sp. MWH-Aus1W21]|uniref:CaiB/BaiF CoA transferase family protein n=1 Tax=Polynucleobacter sp. MWH-Aus1W21 TaxID=1855880 RepID=UPI001BFEE444|nr:CaiB/BaiF CoA-transferase family protein [Polynucleobacter sp. MWH-Aus1W21]QWD66881.1 CoA transferase [Polynucleobacter sp. MWH-Aus1W21]
MSQQKTLPYEGIRIVEFTHMVMGPTCGMVLGDLGAEVIKVEPIDGDKTRDLVGSGAGFFPMFNRNKKSIAVDMKSAEGIELVRKLVATADVVSENFKPQTMAKLGLDYETLKKTNPKLIYVSHKGFLPGPYDHRTALDEVVQMMGGLAYMTGPEDRPLRAGSSVNDIMGGVFGAIGVMAALRQREITGEGQEIQSSLFENNVFLVGQHMMQYAVTGKAAKPMPSRISAWAIYDVFELGNGDKVFLAVVTDTQWKIFCDVFGFSDLYENPLLKLNKQRVEARPTLIPEIKKRISGYTASQISAIFEEHGLPFAPITKPEELFDDPHLIATGGLAPITLTDGPRAGDQTTAPLLPIMMDGRRLGVRLNPPKSGEQTQEILAELGYSVSEIDGLVSNGLVNC